MYIVIQRYSKLLSTF